MKRNVWLAAPAIALLACPVLFPNNRAASTKRQSAGSVPPIVLLGARVYVSPFRSPIGDGVVIIRDGKIAAAGTRAQVPVPEGLGILDCRGMTIMAGFQNSHVHFSEPKWNDAGKSPADQLTNQLREMFTRYGFTSVVDLGSYLQNTEALRDRIESGEVAGPRILTAGSPLYPPNGVPFYVKSSLPSDIVKLLSQPRTPAEAVKEVDEHVAQGADLIKLFTGSWVARGQVITMPLDVARAAVDEAHKKGKLVFAHPSNVAGVQVALHAGVDVLAHSVEETNGWNRSYLKKMKNNGMWLIPTLKLFKDDSNIADILREVQDYSQLHRPILFGTDVGFLTDYDPTDEYELMQRAGLEFPQILESLTTAPAKRLGETAIRGEVKAGMNADLVVVQGDPARDIHALTHVSYVFRDGKIIYSMFDR